MHTAPSLFEMSRLIQVIKTLIFRNPHLSGVENLARISVVSVQEVGVAILVRNLVWRTRFRETARNCMRVLIAEDDRVSLRMLDGLLSGWGYQVVSASSGIQALQILQQDDAPRLAILDWTMPGLTGVQVCERIREVRTPTPPHIILLTARTGNLDLVAGLTAGASDYIRKPFDSQELKARIDVGRTVVELQSRVAQRMLEFQDYVEDSPLGIILVEQDGSISFANSRAYSIFGYESEELIGQSVEVLVPNSFRRHHTEQRDAYLREPQKRMMAERSNLCGLRKNGTHVPLQIGLNSIPKKSAVKVACTIVDLTELRSAESRLDQFFKLSRDIFCIASLDGYLLVMNPAHGELLGYTDEEFKSRTFYSFFHPDDVSAAVAQVERLSGGHEVVNFRCRSRAKDGTDYWIEWNARAVPDENKIYAVGRNITERLRSENELKYRENRERSLLDHTPAIISIKDTMGRYEFVNDKHAALISGNAANAVGRTARDFFSAADADRIAERERQILRTGEVVTMEDILRQSDGDHTYVSVNFPLFDPNGNVSATASISTDVTEQLQSQEREREVQTARAFQQQLYPRGGLSLVGVDVAGWARPATGLCGDYYDYIQVGPQQLKIGIGDVSGHGIGPALQMLNVSCTVRTMAKINCSLSTIIGELNRDLCETLPVGSFVSMFLAEIDLMTRQLSYLGAGHESILVRSDGTVHQLKSTHLLLGVDPSIEFSEVVSVPVQLGDVLLLLTDGLTEAMNAKRELFGNDRLIEVLRHQRRNSAREIIDGIFHAIDDFAGTKLHKDDLTAVAIKITE